MVWPGDCLSECNWALNQNRAPEQHLDEISSKCGASDLGSLTFWGSIPDILYS